MRPDEVTVQQFRAAMGSFAAGVTIITTMDPYDVPHALTATAFSSVSMNPPLCLVCVDRRARSYRPMLLKGHFGVNILSAGQEDLSTLFATPMSDKFSKVKWWRGDRTGCPLLEGALAWMECQVLEVHSGGDHDIFIGRLLSVEVRDGSPLVYWRGRYSSLPPPPRESTTATSAPQVSS